MRHFSILSLSFLICKMGLKTAALPSEGLGTRICEAVVLAQEHSRYSLRLAFCRTGAVWPLVSQLSTPEAMSKLQAKEHVTQG